MENRCSTPWSALPRASGRVTRGTEGESELLGDHPEQGQTAEVFAIVFAAAATGLFALERFGQRLHATEMHLRGAYALSCVIGILALVTMVVAGHSGATLVWKDLGNFVQSAK